MSIHRRAAKRDDNEPAIRQRFGHHGWHTEQMSGAGMPDLLVWPAFMLSIQPDRRGPLSVAATLVDVKMPDGKVTTAQSKKWGELHNKGIPVYVVRTAEDVDALVRGDLAAWEPDAVKLRKGLAVAEAIRTYPIPGDSPVDIRTPRGKGVRPPENGSDRLKPCGCKRSMGRCKHSGTYTPPRGKGVSPPENGSDFPLPARCSKQGCRKRLPCKVHSHHLMSGYTPPRSTPMDAEETFAPPLRCTARGCSCLSVDGLFCKDHAP